MHIFPIDFIYGFTHRQNSQSRENINSPEDEVGEVSVADGGGGETSQGTIHKHTYTTVI